MRESFPGMSVALLAGGRSSRFGRDKASEPIGVKSSLERIIDAASSIGDLWLVGGLCESHPKCRGYIPDLDPGGGPLQAITAFIQKVPEDDFLVLACDIPFVTNRLLKVLAEPLEAGVDARIPLLDGRLQYLLAHYGGDSRRRFESAFHEGTRAVHKVVSDLNVHFVEENELKKAGVLSAVMNDFDDLDELAHLLKLNQES
jgi:molybdopterin-guanine dinucleotide biosynthesis protein A